jgi:CspA family cold shock protein
LADVLRAERLLAERVIAKGTVKRFSVEDGCGFISADEGDDDLFVRSGSIACGGLETLSVGTRVEFEVHEGLRGLEAFDVVPV